MDLKKKGPTNRTGTKISFHARCRDFDTLDFEYEILAKRFQELAYLNKGVKISFKDLRPAEPVHNVYRLKAASVFLCPASEPQQGCYDQKTHLYRGPGGKYGPGDCHAVQYRATLNSSIPLPTTFPPMRGHP
jgi:hypothetical protein